MCGFEINYFENRVLQPDCVKFALQGLVLRQNAYRNMFNKQHSCLLRAAPVTACVSKDFEKQNCPQYWIETAEGQKQLTPPLL